MKRKEVQTGVVDGFVPYGPIATEDPAAAAEMAARFADEEELLDYSSTDGEFEDACVLFAVSLVGSVPDSRARPPMNAGGVTTYCFANSMLALVF